MASNVSVYFRYSRIAMDENQVIEFKGHRSFSVNEVLHRDDERPSRQQVSKAACGILNSKISGKIFLGVIDNGEVNGIMMSPWQQQHFVLNRFSPKVPDHFYNIKFVPVIEPDETSYNPPPLSWLTAFGEDPPKHYIHARGECWCDLRSRAFLDQGFVYPTWVIEIHIFGWNEEDPRTKEFLATAKWAYPLERYFISDNGEGYIRRSTSTFSLPKPSF